MLQDGVPTLRDWIDRTPRFPRLRVNQRESSCSLTEQEQQEIIEIATFLFRTDCVGVRWNSTKAVFAMHNKCDNIISGSPMGLVLLDKGFMYGKGIRRVARCRFREPPCK